jgi:hypothetical protein
MSSFHPSSFRGCRSSLLACTLLGCCASLPAAEVVLSDLRFGLESLPTSFTYHVHDGGSEDSGSSTFQFGFGLAGRGVYAFGAPGSSGAFFVGGALDLQAYTYDGSGRYDVAMLRALGGYAYAFDDRWTAEICPFVGAGLGSFRIPGNDLFQPITTSGHVFDYGIDVGVSYALSRHWLIQARAGWLVSTATLSGEGLDVTLDQSGPTGFLGVAYRFGGTPPPIR